MDITITISGKTEEKLSELAKKNGKNIADVAVGLLDEKIEEEFVALINEDEYVNPFEKITGMFSSGRTDTSERMSELLREADLDPAEGFSIK
jgi:hypothetical protein